MTQKPRIRRWPTLFGPVLRWEMTRFGRRSGPFVQKVLIAALVFWSVWSSSDSGLQDQKSIKTLAEFTQNIVISIQLISFAGSALLVIFGICFAFTEAWDQGTLEDLLTTDLLPHEIIFGMIGTRLVHAVNILCIPLPIAAILKVWGGIDLEVIMSRFVFSMISLVGVAGCCLIICSRRRLFSALVTRSLVLFLAIELNSCCMDFCCFFPKFGGSSSCILCLGIMTKQSHYSQLRASCLS